jgi:hypothetical protein
MKAITKASRVNTALQIIQYMKHGMNVVAACKEVSVPRSTFYDILKMNPEAIAEYEKMVVDLA